MTEPVIAVIDTDVNFLSSINETLAQSGYIAILSRGDSTAPSFIEREQPSLIIIDGMLCRSEPANEVVANAAAHHIPMLMTFSNRDVALLGRAPTTPDYESLAKPIDPGELRSKLSHALGQTMEIAGKQ